MNTFFGVILGGGGGYLLCLLITRIRQEEIAHDRGLIRQWMGDNDAWALAQAELFAAEQPHVTGELVAVETHELPALSAESHEDEQAADEDTDRRGVGAWLLETLIRLCSDLYDRIAEAWQSWRTRDEVGNGDGIGAVLAASGYDLDEQPESDAEAFAIEVAEIREVEGRKRVRAAAHWNDGTAVHSTVYVGRRRKVGA